MTTAIAPRSTRPLAEVAKHLIRPAGIVSTDWSALQKFCRRDLGIRFDGWQNGAAALALSRDTEGQLATTVGGVGMSVPRQVGKTYMWAGVLFTLCIKRPGLKVLWTAHHARTHGETFLEMQAFADRPLIKAFIEQVFTGSGDEEVRFKNTSRILFGARERGFGRGIPNVSVLVFDEAQILSEAALQNMLASMNRSKFGLHVYLGTPPKPTDNSEVWMRMRTEALNGEATDLLWIEMGADDDADPDDREQWLKANASYPHHTPEASIKRLRRKLDPDGFRREGLGIYGSDTWTVFDLVEWVKLENLKAVAPKRVALVVDVSPYRSAAAIAVAGDGSEGKTLVLVYCLEVGEAAVKVAELVATGAVCEVALTSGEARGLQADLVTKHVEFEKLTPGDVAASCTAFQVAVADGTIEHVGQQELDVAVANARTRRTGDAETWDRDFKVDVSPLVAAAAAFHRWGVQEKPKPYDVLQSVW